MRIFQIGFNKCGTSSIHRTFTAAGHPSVHWERGRIAKDMAASRSRGQKLIPERHARTVCFTDMELETESESVFAGKWFRELDGQYPGSKFILNTRSEDAWIRSRIGHLKGEYLRDAMQRTGLRRGALLRSWRREWREHHAAVKAYFSGRPGDLLVLDIENDDPMKLARFLPTMGLGKLLHRNRS